MGYYTHLRLSLKLVNIPLGVIEVLEKLAEAKDDVEPIPGVPFFECDHFGQLFWVPREDEAKAAAVKRTRDGGCLLNIDSYFKNYQDEIRWLCKWLDPYVYAPERVKCGSWRGECGPGGPIYFGPGGFEYGDIRLPEDGVRHSPRKPK